MIKDAKGTILVTTLWILALLTLLALGIGIRVGMDIKLIGFSLNSSKAHYLAEAGLRKTIALLEEDSNKNLDSFNEIWSCGFDFDDEEYVLREIALGEGSFTVSYEVGKDEEGNPICLYGASDEEAKLNINEIGSGLLAKVPGFSGEIVLAIVDWRDEDSLPGLNGAEDDYYETLENPYECKDARFSVPEELLLVAGVTEEIYNSVKDIITVYGESKAVNINTAPEGVLAVLAGEEFEALAAKIINYRNGSDELPGTEDDNIFVSVKTVGATLGIAGQLDVARVCNEIELNRLRELVKGGYFKVRSNTFRIVSRGEIKGGRVKKTIEAVVRRSEEGSEILYYYED